ncbi:MAG: DinB family protein [Dehalococcoidales bacterium]|nr:DinB family protein [Dehalococcoidales bacterium]
MDGKEILVNGYEDVQGALESTLDGLTAEEMDWQPRPDCNSIGWTAWHLIRVEDSQIASLMGEEQLWTKGGWHGRFNRPADAEDSGFGHTPEEVAQFKSPAVQVFIDYGKAVSERTRQYLLGMSATDLERPIGEYWEGTPVQTGWRLLSVLEDCLEHAGQMAYVRGLRQGKGWQPY